MSKCQNIMPKMSKMSNKKLKCHERKVYDQNFYGGRGGGWGGGIAVMKDA